MNLKHYNIRYLFSLCLTALIIASCANRGVGPQGGPKDTIPPIPLHAEPELGALEFKGKRIEVTFSEYLQLDNISQNLLMSPPQQTPPDVKARGKKLIVQFQDTLRDSTTYTIDFGSAVCDYREKNPLHGFSYYFSTGSEIDTLMTIGCVYDAENLNPLQGMLVGIYSNLADSAFVSEPFLRIAKTDSAGFFRIGNVHPGSYRIYAVNDVSRDYRLTIGEALAYSDDVISVYPPKPVTAPEEPDTLAMPDSLNNFMAIAQMDSLMAMDTLVSMDTVASLDSTVLGFKRDMKAVKSMITHSELTRLFLFKETQHKLYLLRTLREQQHRVQVYFSSSPDSLPQFRSLSDSLNYHVQYSAKGDTATIWLLDSMSIMQDSLFFEARYRRTDSVFHLEWALDTLRAIWRAPKMTAKALEAQERQNRNRRLEIRCNARKDFELFDTLRLHITTPLARIERDSMHLFECVDTDRKPIPFTIAPNDTLPMRLTILANMKAGYKYELKLDSGAMTDIYGISHIANTYSLQLKTPSDYSTLRIKLSPFVPEARIQVLNNKDEVLRELPAVPEGAFFEYLKPDTYYLRMYIDENGDGKWTTGDWQLKRQPEPVYYYPQSVQTKSNWDFEEEWDYHAVEQTSSKPKELIKASANKKK